jgi:hypothetical protein
VTTPTQTQMVPSPLHAAIAQLYASIQGDQSAMAGALKNTCLQMGDNIAWFGPTASSWNNDLTGHSVHLGSCIAAAVTVLEEALANTPANCTPQQARMEIMIMDGRIQ